MNQKKKRARPRAVEEPALVYGVEDREGGARDWAMGAVVARIQKGLPFGEFDALRELLGLSAERLAGHLAISKSTLMRRRRAGRLDPLESDRLLRYARLFTRAEEVLGDAEDARVWLHTPARALAHEKPLAFAETEAGAREVEMLLGRIEYGVFT